jgi:hypothetical protein
MTGGLRLPLTDSVSERMVYFRRVADGKKNGSARQARRKRRKEERRTRTMADGRAGVEREGRKGRVRSAAE